MRSKGFYSLNKRLIDVFFSLTGIILMIPLWVVVAAVIKTDSPGPVIFSQNRVGKNGQIFKIYKFRTMCLDAEKKLEGLKHLNEMDGAMFKIKNDPRITKVGRFLRRTSIDELPQLWNVLKGDMSLVGPRPPLESEVSQYTSYDKQRLLVKPGCSGLWQISGRSDLSFSEMVELDLMYIEKRSTLYDIKIIFRTVIKLLKREGAY